ncbi:MAG: TatD family hydrolase [Verrucomicrobiota bacterium]
MALFDAHCHLQDERLVGIRDSLWVGYEEAKVSQVVVNGTSESDWELVSALAKKNKVVKPSFGVHPWFVHTLSSGWRERLEELWQNPDAAVGEIGFDRCKEPYDVELQWEIFSWQFDRATRLEKPVSIHCLKAWGILSENLKARPKPERGFLLHSFGGSMEIARRFERMGAYFSFSGYFASERKLHLQEVFKQLPIDRILIETDAPDMRGPDVVAPVPFGGDEKGNHPLNLLSIYDYFAALRGMDRLELVDRVASNFRRLFT